MTARPTTPRTRCSRCGSRSPGDIPDGAAVRRALPLPAERVGRDVQPDHPLDDRHATDHGLALEGDPAVHLDADEVQVRAARVDPRLAPATVRRVPDRQAPSQQRAVRIGAVEGLLDDTAVEDPPDRVGPVPATRPRHGPLPDPEVEGLRPERVDAHPAHFASLISSRWPSGSRKKPRSSTRTRPAARGRPRPARPGSRGPRGSRHADRHRMADAIGVARLREADRRLVRRGSRR